MKNHLFALTFHDCFGAMRLYSINVVLITIRPIMHTLSHVGVGFATLYRKTLDFTSLSVSETITVD